MPSFPVKPGSGITPFVVVDFDIGIAEQWLEAALRGGGIGKPVPEIEGALQTALAACKDARTTLRDTIPTIGR